ncbi:vascular endothelial growth factor receptor 1-like, partial [Clarias magur]
MSVVCLPLSAGEDTLELHSADLEMEPLEKQIRDLQVKLAQLRQRKAALESSRTDAHLSQVQRRDTTKPGYSSSGRRALGPGRGPLPLRRRPSSRSRPETTSLLFARR